MDSRRASEQNVSFFDDPHPERLSSPDRQDVTPWQPFVGAGMSSANLNNEDYFSDQPKPQGQNRDRLRIEMVDFPFSPSSTCKKKRPPLSWHLRTEEQAKIGNAWNSNRTGEQTQEVLACLGLRKSRQEFIAANQNSLLST